MRKQIIAAIKAAEKAGGIGARQDEILAFIEGAGGSPNRFKVERLLATMVDEGVLEKVGKGSWAKYCTT